MKTKIMDLKRETRKLKPESGVTLIEMATVIGIVLILGVMILVEYNNMDDKARRNPSLVSAKAIGDALRIYQADKRGYTCNIDALAAYVNLTALKANFTAVDIETNDSCAFGAGFNSLYITGTVKGIQPDYVVNYFIEPVKDPECTNTGALYPCKDKF